MLVRVLLPKFMSIMQIVASGGVNKVDAIGEHVHDYGSLVLATFTVVGYRLSHVAFRAKRFQKQFLETLRHS